MYEKGIKQNKVQSLSKFMDASFPGVCGVEAFHSPAIILCITIARTQIA